jgi:uncharacterized protein (TIGR03083 family)
MTPEDWIAAIEIRVPSCPDWNLADLLSHTGWVYRFWAFVAELPEGERVNRENSMAAGLPKTGSTQRPDAELLPWFHESLQGLMDAYDRQPSAKVIDSRYWGPQPLSWISRRMAHETGIHRWDAEQALGDVSGFDPVLAADGVDEFLEFWVPLGFRYADFGGVGRSVGLEATDSDDSWRISVEAGTTSWRRGQGDADVIARGPAGDLYLFVWGRAPTGDLLVAGDSGTLSDWQSAAAI